MDPHFPLHVRVPDHCTSAQRVGITTELIRSFCTRKQLSNSTLSAVYNFPFRKSDPQQRRCTIVVCFRSQIRGLELRDTIKTHSLKSTAQLFSQFTLYVGVDVPRNWKSLIGLNLLRWHHRILFIQEKEW